MPRSGATFRIGEFFLARRPNSPAWCACWFDARTGQVRRRSLGTANLEEAKLELAVHAVTHETVVGASPAVVRVGDVLLRYFDQHAGALPSGESAAAHLQHWVDHWGNASIADLTPRAQRKFIAILKAKRTKAGTPFSPGYVRRILVTGRAALRRAVAEQELATVPKILVPPKVAPQRQARKLEPREVAALLIAAREQSDRLHLFCLLGLGTLARPGAILDLTVDQVNVERRLIDLLPPGREQTKKRRPVVPLVDALLPWVRRAMDASENGHLIEYHGRPVASLKKAFSKAVAAAGLERAARVTPYSLRHTMATELRARGVQAWDLSGQMGHTAAGTTEIYAEHAPDYRSAVAGAIETYFQSMQTSCGGDICITLAGQRASNVRAVNG